LGKTINFKLDQIRKEARAISLLLSDTFAKHADFLSKLRFDLSIDECMNVAQISR
jgi:transcription antitermination factor NusA-like protein